MAELPRRRADAGSGRRPTPASTPSRRCAATDDLLAELRAVKGLIEERFGALAFMEKLQRRPAEARLAQKLLDCGFSPMLVRKMADGFKAEAGDETEWAAQILERNLRTAGAHEAIEDRGGVFALIGATGVGKTTTTAKIAAAFAARHGAANLGLITLDAYRVGAHEQLRAYGRILGVPVHTAHDRASLEDLLELLTAKKMVLIDTAGMAQRDTRTQRAARDALASQRPAPARRQRRVAGRDDRGRAGRLPRDGPAPASSSASSTRPSSSARRSTPRSATSSPSSASPTASACRKTGIACRPTPWCSGRCAAAAAPPGASTPPR